MLALRKCVVASFTKCPSLFRQPVRCFFYVNNRSEWFPAEQQGEEPNIPLRETFNFRPLLGELKRLGKEVVDATYNKEFYTEPRHDDIMIQWKFDQPGSYEDWMIVADSDWKFGYSKCELLMSKEKTAIFRGYLNPTPPKDGRTTYAGLASMKTKRLYKAFFRKASYNRWQKFSHLLFKVRGDGRKYNIILNTPGYYDFTWHDYYTYPLYTHGGPYWQFEKIPFSKFYHAVHNRIQDRQEGSVTPWFRTSCNGTNLISSIAISMMDTFEGPFQLEIDFIGVYNDITHFEEFAYESYRQPIVYI